jgi:predicted MPP superfamily phosphohydrolase
MWQILAGVVLLVYTGINIYTGVRILDLARHFLPSFWALVFWPLYFLFCYSFILTLFLRLDRVRPLRQAALYALPFVIYFFLALLVIDGARLVLRLMNRPPSPGFSLAGTGIALGLALLAMIYGAFHARDIRTVHYEITLNKDLGGSLRIAHISDLHLGVSVGRKWAANIVDAVNRTKPDLICITGDIFDNNLDAIRDLDGVAAELRRLQAPLGVYACLGNHDVDRISLSALREGFPLVRIYDFLKKANIILLEDEVELVAERFYLAGRRDARPIGLRQERKSAAELTAGLDKSRPIIFLDHQPVDFPGNEGAGADLILSGHTHKGQFFPGNIFTARIYKKAGAVHYGYWRGNAAQGIVTSGSGVWGPPIRIATNSEVAVIDIKFEK